MTPKQQAVVVVSALFQINLETREKDKEDTNMEKFGFIGEM